MAKKKYNIENPDSYYRAPGKDISLQDFNTAYIEYLDKREELRKQKLNLQNIVYYYEDDQVDPEMVFMWVNLDLKEYFLFLDDADTENVKNGIDALMSQYSYTCSYVLVETDIPVADLITTMTTFALDYGVANGCIDVTSKYVIDPENPVWIINFLDDIFTRYYNMNDKIVKPVIPAIEEFDKLPITVIGHGSMNARSLSKERDILKIDEYVVEDKGVFVGQWPVTRGFYLSFFEGHAFYIPVGFHIEPISGKYPEHLILVNVFLPNVIGFLIIPRKPFVAFGKANEYTRHTLTGIDFLQLTLELNRYHQADFMNLMRQMNKHYDLTGHQTYGKGVTSTHLWGYKYHQGGIVYFEKLYTDPLLPNKYYSLTTIEILQAMMEYGPELRTNQAILGNMMSMYGAAMNALASMGDIGLPTYDNPMPGYV